MEGLRTPFWYTVYRAKNDEVVVCGDARYCAKYFGCSLNTFHSMVSHVKTGANKKYCIVVEDTDNCTYKVYGANNKGKNFVDNVRANGLYADGMNDAEIARELGVSTKSILSWRTRRGFPPNGKRGRPRKKEEEV